MSGLGLVWSGSEVGWARGSGDYHVSMSTYGYENECLVHGAAFSALDILDGFQAFSWVWRYSTLGRNEHPWHCPWPCDADYLSTTPFC